MENKEKSFIIYNVHYTSITLSKTCKKKLEFLLMLDECKINCISL